MDRAPYISSVRTKATDMFQRVKPRMRMRRAPASVVQLQEKSHRRAIIARIVLVVCVLAVLLALALVVGDSNYHATAIGWTPFVAAIVAIGGAYAYVRVLARSLTVTENPRLTDCKRGMETPYNVHFANRSPLVFFKIESNFFISDLFGNVANETTTTIALGPHEVYDMGFTARFEHIGTYTAGLERVVVSDFLGLFSRNIYNRAHHDVEVTPNIQQLERIIFDDAATSETSSAATAVLADSMDYAQVREYVPGDPLKTIHWNLSARTNTYMTRMYEVYTEPGVGIVMDFYADSDDARELMGMFDCVVESAFSIAAYAHQKGMDADVLFEDKYGVERRVPSWTDDEMPTLVSDMPTMSNDARDALAAPQILERQISSRQGQSTLVLCSANIDSQAVSTLVDAKAAHRAAFMVAVVPADLDGRARDAYLAPLSQLDESDIPYVAISRPEELGAAVS